MDRLPTEQELMELSRRAAIYLTAECLSQIKDCYRLPVELAEREFYVRCFASVAASGKKFAAGEEINLHEAPGMAAASVLSGLKSSSFADLRKQQAAADSAGAARLLALAIARAKSEGQRPAEDVARYAAEALKLIVSAAGQASSGRGETLASRIGAAFSALRQAGLGSRGELGREILASEFEHLMEPDSPTE